MSENVTSINGIRHRFWHEKFLQDFQHLLLPFILVYNNVCTCNWTSSPSVWVMCLRLIFVILCQIPCYILLSYKNLTHHSNDNYCNLSYQSVVIFLTENQYWVQEHEPKFLQLQNFYQPKLLFSLEPINPLCIYHIFHQSLFQWNYKTMFLTGRYCHAWFPYSGCPSAELVIYHDMNVNASGGISSTHS